MRTMNDLISRQEAIQAIINTPSGVDKNKTLKDKYDGAAYRQHEILDIIQSMPPAQQWIPVKRHIITDDERECEGYPEEWLYYFDCLMPNDGERIIVHLKNGFIAADECFVDDCDCFRLDSGSNWIDEVIAWMPLPEPYEEEE